MMQFELIESYLLLFLLFIIGFSGLIISRVHFILILMSFEIILIGFCLYLMTISAKYDDIVGQIFFMFILCIAGIESSFGLILLIIYYRLYGSIEYNLLEKVKVTL